MKLEGTHWSVKWYRHYVKLGGFGRDPENFCRFWRVILIWAPLRWTWSGKDGRFPPLAGLFVAAVAIIMIGVSAVQLTDVYRRQGAAAFVPGSDTTLGIGLIVAGVFAFFGILFVWSDLYRLFKEYYATAQGKRFCPLIETVPLIDPIPVVAEGPQITEESDDEGEED